MAETQPQNLTAICPTVQEDRRALMNIVCQEGVSDVASGSLKVTTGGAGLDLSVASGGGFVFSEFAEDGMYTIYNDSPVVLTASTADPTNPRIDRVIAQVRDSDFGDGADDWILTIVAGTPTPGATLANLSGAGALPDRAITLAYILVPATFAGPFVNATHILDARTGFVACGKKETFSTLFTRNAPQTFGTTGQSILTFNAGSSGSAVGDHWITEGSGTVTVKRAGLYLVEGMVQWASNSSGYRSAVLTTTARTVAQRFMAAPTLQSNHSLSLVGPLAAGDTISLSARQASGVSLDVELAALSVTFLGVLAP